MLLRKRRVAGFTVGADKVCLSQEIDVHKAVWTHTPSSLAFNPYQQINANGTSNTKKIPAYQAIACSMLM